MPSSPFYTGILARDCGLVLSAGSEGEAVVLNGALTVFRGRRAGGRVLLPATEIKPFGNTLAMDGRAPLRARRRKRARNAGADG